MPETHVAGAQGHEQDWSEEHWKRPWQPILSRDGIRRWLSSWERKGGSIQLYRACWAF